FTSSRTRPWVVNMGSAGLGTEVAHAQLSAEKFGRAWARGSARRAADVITQALAGDLTVAADAGAARAAGLTGREGEVAMLMARGLSNRAIAERLVIAEGTAGLHAKRVLQKLGCHSRAEVAGKLQPQG
ncbi:MAG: LuxR C-terminal-related transcriptional regulator, partial [Dehalococcoidia bacterium]|nr:LuxR C-terminal-related transcriptional regulator [Dehalococcoidia bacterium]